MEFFRQKKALYHIKITDLGLSSSVSRGNNVTNTRGDHSKQYITRSSSSRLQKADNVYMQESLTRYSSDLLGKCKLAASALNYKFPGYVIRGQIRCKKNETSSYLRIRCPSDLLNIV